MEIEEQIGQELRLNKHRSGYSKNHLNPSTSSLTSTSAIKHEKIHGPNTGGNFGGVPSASGAGMIQSTSMIDTYYIYSFDGKLMAEYDHDGNCVKDYIYVGNRLIAEYHSQTGNYYYYMSDQINSTRIVTDDSGNVVYSEAYGPFGGVQKNWTKNYNPKLKFSGKEREAYGDLDYFGARYYDHNSYRFISVDPIINKGEALSNPQLWNLYCYCMNNPITYLDPDGRIFKESSKEEIYQKVPVIKQIDDAIEKFNQARQFCMDMTLSIAMGFFMGPIDFAVPRIGGVSRGGSEKGLTIGKKFFKGKTFKQIDKIFRKKGFKIKGQDPLSGKGSYINPKTGTKYYLDKGGWYRVPGKGRVYESPHVDVEIKGITQKFKFFLGD
jgi:RHS repeat-associated protein